VDRPAIGLALHPDEEYLERVMPLYESEAELLELAPETTWALDERGALIDNGFHARFLALGQRLHLPFVAHGVGLSPGSAGDPGRRARWLARVAASHQRFEFRWYTEHLGVTVLDGLEMTLPLGLPMTPAAAAISRACLAEMRAVVPTVGLENTAIYFMHGDPLHEPDFLREILGDSDHLLLDLHNLYTIADNLGFDPAAYLARLDLRRVIEIHLSGGVASDPSWLPSRRVLRLDSHDDAVPEPVWRLFADVLPRCPGLRAVIVERMEGSVGPGDELLLRDELRRARRMVQQLHRPGPVASSPAPHHAPDPAAIAELLAHERRLVHALRAPDPMAALAGDPTRAAIDPDGLRLAALFIARLRFERLQHGDLEAAAHFDRDPAGFAAVFRRYHAEVPPTAAFPQDEAAHYRRWRG
jgi:hypothetical protein